MSGDDDNGSRAHRQRTLTHHSESSGPPSTSEDKELSRWSSTGVLLVIGLATLAMSYTELKLLFLSLFAIAAFRDVLVGKRVIVYRRLVIFYLAICSIGLTWSLVGAGHATAPLGAITDSVRLYVAWSLAFIWLLSTIRLRASLRTIHLGLVIAGITIAVMNLVAVADQIAGWGLIGEGIRKEMELRVGLHEGYIQITSKNIGSLFLITPYLLSIQFTANTESFNGPLVKVSLLLTMIIAALSGRRGLWLVIALTPFGILALGWLTGMLKQASPTRRRLLSGYCGLVGMALGWAALAPDRVGEIDYVRHFEAAFSAQDERTIQKSYLVNAFADSPLLGSGFGGYAGYRRNDERPWTYELTYFQALFNLGLIGFVLLAGLYTSYFVQVLRLLRLYRGNGGVPFSILVGICGLLFGSYSNPYLGSFDFLFFVGLLPFLSTFQRGFADGSDAPRALQSP